MSNAAALVPGAEATFTKAPLDMSPASPTGP